MLSFSQVIAQDTLPYVKSYNYLSSENLSFIPNQVGEDLGFSIGLASLGDIDGNGSSDIAVSATAANNGRGEVYVLLMNTDGTVLSHQIINHLSPNGPPLVVDESFGQRITNLGDVDGDGVTDIAVRTRPWTNTNPEVYVVFLNADGTLKSYTKFGAGTGGFTGNFSADGHFTDIEGVGDVDGDGIPDLIASSSNADYGGNGTGIIRYIYLNANGTVKNYKTIGATSNWPNCPLMANSDFGQSIASLGDLDGDGINDIAVSARRHQNGTVFILFMNADQTVKSHSTINSANITTDITWPAQFGWAIDNLGDLNGDGTNDLLATARMANVGGVKDGKAIIVYLNADGSVQSEEVIGEGIIAETTGLGLHDNARMGHSCAVIGDVDGDKVTDIALGALHHLGGGATEKWGRLYLFNLNPKPLVVDYSTTNQTASTLGTVDLTVYGGVRPYDYSWGSNFPSDSLFGAYKDDIDQNFNNLLLPTLDLSDFTLSSLSILSEADVDGLEAGVYSLGITDESESQIKKDIKVGYEFSTLIETGAIYDANGELIEKTSGDGWSNMQLTTKNILPRGEDGYISFTAPQTGPMIAVGMRSIDVLPQSGYNHMEAAIYLENNDVSIWDGTNLQSTGVNFESGSEFRLERSYEGYALFLNGEPLINVSGDIGLDLVIDVAIYETQASITHVQTSFPATFNASSAVTQIGALSPNSGEIAVSAVDAFAPFTYAWVDEPSNTEKDRNGMDVGKYTLSVVSGYNNETQLYNVLVGNEIIFEESENSEVENVNSGVDVNPKNTEGVWNEIATTLNAFENNDSHWLCFRPEQENKKPTAHLVGLKNDISGLLWCGWWIHSFGDQFMAHAFDQNRIVGRTLIRKNTHLGIEVNNGVIDFTLNDSTILNGSYSGLQGLSRIALASNADEGTIRDLTTSIAVPIELNTSYLNSNINFTHATPDGLSKSAQSGGKATVELTSPKSGDHILDVPATTDVHPMKIMYELSAGEASNMRIEVDGTVFPMDPQLYTTVAPNKIVLFDEAEAYFEEANPAFQVLLEDALVMSPNGDTNYDEFEVVLDNPSWAYQLTIKDRDSNLLFQSSDPLEKWNGQFLNNGSLVDQGIYVYEIDLEGTLFTGQFMVKY